MKRLHQVFFWSRLWFDVRPLIRRLWWQLQGARFGSGTRVPPLVISWPHQLSVGSHCILEPDIVFKFAGLWCAQPSIVVGNRTFVGRNCEFSISARIDIGDDCLIASGCKFIDHNHSFAFGTPINKQPNPSAPILIEEDVWLGVNVVVLKGVKIERGAIVAAGAVVTKDIGAGEIWGGVPARKIKQRPDWQN